MNKPKIVIDGQSGTTGLEIVKRLGPRDDLDLLLLPEDKRHDEATRREYFSKADLIFLCLPDAASKEAALWIDIKTRVIDASTAHRTDPDWVYGLPELCPGQKDKIKNSTRVANPGCHATGFISIVYPLVEQGLIANDTILSCTSLTGYSGGGKKMIASYENEKTPLMEAPGAYALSLQHKHLREMKGICHLEQEPLFLPVVDDYLRGMLTTILLPLNAHKVHALYESYYQDGLIRVHPFGYEGSLYANTMADKDDLQIIVTGNEKQTCISALFDNLGKGACGAAIQNMNLMLGLEETKGLHL